MNFTYTHLEDFSEDILSKAQSGLQLTNRELAERSGIELGLLKSLKSGEVDEEAISAVAEQLNLDSKTLIQSAQKAWLPNPIELTKGRVFVSHFRSMDVNAYLFYSNDGGAVLFDTGVDAAPILEFLSKNQLELVGVVLTHGHPDHVAALPSLLGAFPDCPVYAHPIEKIAGTQPIEWQQKVDVGPFSLDCLSTPGHTPGGTSFRFDSPDGPICVVGDAIFAGSVGGCAADYANALRSISRNLLSLDPETILCPGHGPLTTVAEEKKNNPFFAG
ncbi:MAG: MBL fold metallo-hydrolase [Verrucomicrobiota bacterium]